MDIHNHILPERWPDLKEVRRKETEERGDFDNFLYYIRDMVMAGGSSSTTTAKGRQGC